jgi:hypothetical protein
VQIVLVAGGSRAGAPHNPGARAADSIPVLEGSHGDQGRIVAEVLLGIIDADLGSHRANDPGWTPTLPALGQLFGLTDLLIPPRAGQQQRESAPPGSQPAETSAPPTTGALG